ncbi:MAG: hypothetical protein GDA48_25530 [Hormoscilla sp. GM102CHS1]|nr:hypothetical protein [Hormoscilla sp. GM102CHS1]
MASRPTCRKQAIGTSGEGASTPERTGTPPVTARRPPTRGEMREEKILTLWGKVIYD